MSSDQTSLRRRAYALLERGRQGHVPGRIFDLALAVVIIVSVAAIIVDSDTTLGAEVKRVLRRIEMVAIAVFTVEYLLRVWVAVEDPRRRFHHPILGRLRYLVTPMAVIDLIVILPFYLALFLTVLPPYIGVLRVMRLFKLIRLSGAFDMIATVIRAEIGSLIAALAILAMTIVVFATMGYIAEHEAQPEKFRNIATAMYWAVITLTTVGYGDMTPITPAGRVIAGMATITGIILFVLPAGILSSGFVEELRRRSFLMNWNIVARVPMFRDLGPGKIAGIAQALRLKKAEAGELVVRKGSPANALYFIETGELEVHAAGERPVLRAGDFFGESTLLTGGVRSADVTARTACRLMVLDSAALRMILAENPDIEAEIMRVMKERTAAVDGEAPPARQ